VDLFYAVSFDYGVWGVFTEVLGDGLLLVGYGFGVDCCGLDVGFGLGVSVLWIEKINNVSVSRVINFINNKWFYVELEL